MEKKNFFLNILMVKNNEPSDEKVISVLKRKYITQSTFV